MLSIYAIYLSYGPRFFFPSADTAVQRSHPRVATRVDKGPFGSGRPSFALFLHSDILYN